MKENPSHRDRSNNFKYRCDQRRDQKHYKTDTMTIQNGGGGGEKRRSNYGWKFSKLKMMLLLSTITLKQYFLYADFFFKSEIFYPHWQPDIIFFHGNIVILYCIWD